MKLFNPFLYYILSLIYITSYQVLSVPITIEKRAYTTLRKGSKGQEVKNLQEKLISLGYSCGPSGADGDFGSNTVFCVFAFQQVNGLSTDGIAGNETQTQLYSNNAQRNIVNGDETSLSSSLSSSTTDLFNTLSKGDKGNLVKRAQLRLILLGYYCGNTGADGDFGNNTMECVKTFQTNNNLPTTGEINEPTHKKLFSKNAINVKRMITTTLTRFVNTALMEYNYEGKKINNNKYSKFGAWYGINPGEWCAMFVSWVANENKSIKNHIINKSSAVRILKQQFIDNGRYGAKEIYIPEYGDILFLTNNQSHVAIVVGVTTDYVYTIEGNHSNKVDAVKRSINDSHISGYGKNNSGNSGYPIDYL
ncbi:hypothetical protein BCR32DRAFT_292346 [Anaeromyces robustus]|uniref:Uncharacterized protein n=1 Tax=Anaeromyces robustus TaxID=1754192 RepID=A0A1Y1XAW0_9FUNG|nr:hypothetical protein BCR32DRAFT_292346 [Anaeromyces robustus]|eukprot:ORX82869.1 hypothetical protein BCR32DRAFT_292346 [Anaeromyces robustus]